MALCSSCTTLLETLAIFYKRFIKNPFIYILLVIGRTTYVRSQNQGVRVQLLKDEHVPVRSMFIKMMLESVR